MDERTKANRAKKRTAKIERVGSGVCKRILTRLCIPSQPPTLSDTQPPTLWSAPIPQTQEENLHILSVSLARLFTTAATLSNAALKHFAEALARLALDSAKPQARAKLPKALVRAPLPAQTTPPPHSNALRPGAWCLVPGVAARIQYNDRSFGVEHLRELAQATGARLQEPECVPIWDVIVDLLLALAASDEAPLRNQASDAAAEICLGAVSLVSVGHIETDDELQLRLLAPVLALAVSPASDVQLRHLGTLYKFLQSVGQALSVGWPRILETLSKVRCADEDDAI